MTTVRTRPMTEDEYADYRARVVPLYADDLQRSGGLDRQAALARSAESFPPTLAEAAAGDRSSLLRVLDASDEPVGWLWLGPHPERPDAVFVYDVEIDAAHQRRGLGRATMLAAEQLVREAGLSALVLNVFGWNDGAQQLYRSLGYQADKILMSKQLQDPS
jgi:ribosomal protein S18 acetylase RimI-like enzyme